MVDAAAALWSAVPTEGVTLTDRGPLNEDVGGDNIMVNTNGQITQPSDVTSEATAYPVAVIYDADGSVIDALLGPTASQPTSSQNNGVLVFVDSINPDATIAHALMILNGLCTPTDNLLAMMSYQIERAFGSVLGLGYSQVNPGALQNGTPGGTQGWPVMDPRSGVCGPLGGVCFPNPNVLRFDDFAALNRLYPIIAENQASFPGKQLTAASTVSLRGVISFRTGSGMQGVNVVARPLDANGNPLYQYTFTAVSGALFSGNHGNPVTGFNDANGTPYLQLGSNDPALQGAFDLSGIPLPPGQTSATNQLSFESINPLYILTIPVGPMSPARLRPPGRSRPSPCPTLRPAARNPSTSRTRPLGAIRMRSAPRPNPAPCLPAGFG
jgi:hypothetical protein